MTTTPDWAEQRPSRWAAERFAAPSVGQRLKEAGGILTPLRSLASIPRLAAANGGDGRPVVVLPGFGASDSSTVVIRRHLGRCGHRADGWGLGRNTGDPLRDAERLLPRLARLAERADRPVNLVGWSLGGVIGREIARDRPDLVHRLATLATPLFGPRYTATRSVFGEERLREIDEQTDVRYRTPLTTPVLALHSRQDGVVDWRTCLDTWSPSVRNEAVSSTHFTIAFDAAVLHRLQRWFAEAPGTDPNSSPDPLDVAPNRR